MHIQFSKVFFALACAGAVSCAPVLSENNLDARAPVPATVAPSLPKPTIKLDPALINPNIIAGLKPGIVAGAAVGSGDKLSPVASDWEFGYGPVNFGYPKKDSVLDTINAHPELGDILGIKNGIAIKNGAAGVIQPGLSPREEAETRA